MTTLTLDKDLLTTLLYGLPEQDRRLLLLRELEGYSVERLCHTTGLNEKSLRARLLGIRRSLLAAAACAAAGR